MPGQANAGHKAGAKGRPRSVDGVLFPPGGHVSSGGGEAALLPSREEVDRAERETDQGEARSVFGAPPHPALRATFSREGRREGVTRRFGAAPIVWGAFLLLMLAQPAAAQTTSPPASPPPAQAAPAPVTGPLKGAAAWQQLVGNTVEAQARGGGYTEFYAADGTVMHLDEDGKSKGKWTLEGDKVCFDYADEDDRSCVDVELDGTKGVFVDEDKSRDTFTFMPGNAKNL